MLDELKKQKIIKLIETSVILTGQEKTDWLALLDLMNDKQIAELEEILQPQVASTTQDRSAKTTQTNNPEQSSVSSMADLTMPKYDARSSAQASLSHISNIPAHLSDPRLAAKKPLISDALKTKTTEPKQAPESVGSKKSPILERDNSVKETAKSSLSGYSVPTRQDNQPFTGLKELSDLERLTASVLHSQNRQVFFQAVSELVQTHGYFQVLQTLEKSPLYSEYINFGRLKLTGSPKNPSLSQEEFEFVTDLLLALKVNRI